MTASSDPRLEKEKHIRYWQRCRDTYLPTPYTSGDSTRLMWACFIFSALDLLSVPLEARERARIRTWVLSLQHPDGGFCGSPNHAYQGQDAHRGEPNIAATFFALILLAMAPEEGAERSAFAGVRRGRLLRWLRKLQREDGSFGQNLWEGRPVGGSDTRHSYLASSIRWMLRGDVSSPDGDAAWVEDVDVDSLVRHIRLGQTYDGGVAELDSHESHAGYAYCGVAALYMLDRPLVSSSESDKDGSHSAIAQGIRDREGLLRFLAGRQFTYLAKEEEEDDADAEDLVEARIGSLSLEESCRHVGFNGRWNKKTDTCYCWWVAGTLAMLGTPFPVNIAPSRRYLLEITQHRIGGFGKVAGAPPDIYHAYLGLAALATMDGGDEDLKEFDAGLCCSRDTTRKIEMARDGLVEGIRGKKGGGESWVDDGFWSSG